MEIIIGIEVIVGVLISVAYITLAERKWLGAMQRRRGPSIVGKYGILQPLSDGLKLGVKEAIRPRGASTRLYWLSPGMTLVLSIMIWSVYPWKYGVVWLDSNLSILVILSISSLSIYGILYSGWSSNSRYSWLGGLRAIAQLISYEVSIGIILMSVGTINKTWNMIEMYESQIEIRNSYSLLPIWLIFVISILAETNRQPFDLSEAESELVGGYMTEYGGFSFAGFYIGEYSFILAMSAWTSIMFWGTLTGSIGTLLISMIYIIIRGTLVRNRYDQLMYIGWMQILPFSIGYLLLMNSIM